jgi:hypothetical protein
MARKPHLLILVGFGDVGKKYVLPAMLRRICLYGRYEDKIIVVETRRPLISWDSEVDECLTSCQDLIDHIDKIKKIKEKLRDAFVEYTPGDDSPVKIKLKIFLKKTNTSDLYILPPPIQINTLN